MCTVARKNTTNLLRSDVYHISVLAVVIVAFGGEIGLSLCKAAISVHYRVALRIYGVSFVSLSVKLTSAARYVFSCQSENELT